MTGISYKNIKDYIKKYESSNMYEEYDETADYEIYIQTAENQDEYNETKLTEYLIKKLNHIKNWNKIPYEVKYWCV